MTRLSEFEDVQPTKSTRVDWDRRECTRKAISRCISSPYSSLTLIRWMSNDHTDHLKYLMIRRNSKLKLASCDEVMNLIAENAKDVRKRLTAHGIGFYTSG